MSNPTTVRFTPEEQDKIKKMAIVYKTNSAVHSRAIALLWAEVGETAEQAWAIVQAQREGRE